MDSVISDIVTDPVHETTCLKCHHLMDVSGLPAFVQIACPECGTQQHVPAKMGTFLLVDLLGKGGMGAVYRGRDTGLDRWVALKVMQSSFGGNPEFVETFRREAQAAAALNHPNIVQIYSFGVSHGQPYLAMELLEGGRLDQMIAKGEPLNEALILKIGVDVAEGLNAAAAINLIHGDVKPENILLDSNGVAKVVDFGLARFKENNEGGTSKGIWGTPYYIAPEKLRGHLSDARTDIYSLGGTLFHALTLKPPFDGETPMDVVKARLKQPAPAISSLRPGVNHEFEAIVSRMLEAEPSRRYPNYASALADMRRVLSTMKPPVMPSVSPTIKKGGKIVLTKKKGSSGMAAPLPMATSTTAITSSEVAGPETAEEPATGIRSPKLRKRILLGVLGVCVLGALIVGGMALSEASKRKDAANREKTLAAQHRKSADKIWSELQAFMVDVSNREVVARGWASNATQTAGIITAGLQQLPEPGECAGIDSNALACSGVVDEYLNRTLASAHVELKTMAELVSTNRLAMQPLTNSAPALQHLSLLTNVPLRVMDLQGTVMVAGEKSKKALESLGVLKQKMDKALKNAQAAIAQAAAEKAEADRLAAEKAREEQAAAEKAAKAQAEVKLLEDNRKANAGMIQQHQFKQAVDALEVVVKGLRTPEGKTAGKQTVKAYQTLVDMKMVFIEGIRAEIKANPEKGYSYGWLKASDILGVDEVKLTLRGDQKIPWTDVPPREIILLYQRFVENGDLTRREKSQFGFAMALYVYDTMSTSETARKQVSKYLTDAIRGYSGLEDLARVVMPDVDAK